MHTPAFKPQRISRSSSLSVSPSWSPKNASSISRQNASSIKRSVVFTPPSFSRDGACEINVRFKPRTEPPFIPSEIIMMFFNCLKESNIHPIDLQLNRLHWALVSKSWYYALSPLQSHVALERMDQIEAVVRRIEGDFNNPFNYAIKSLSLNVIPQCPPNIMALDDLERERTMRVCHVRMGQLLARLVSSLKRVESLSLTMGFWMGEQGDLLGRWLMEALVSSPWASKLKNFILVTPAQTTISSEDLTRLLVAFSNVKRLQIGQAPPAGFFKTSLFPNHPLYSMQRPSLVSLTLHITTDLTLLYHLLSASTGILQHLELGRIGDTYRGHDISRPQLAQFLLPIFVKCPLKHLGISDNDSSHGSAYIDQFLDLENLKQSLISLKVGLFGFRKDQIYSRVLAMKELRDFSFGWPVAPPPPMPMIPNQLHPSPPQSPLYTNHIAPNSRWPPPTDIRIVSLPTFIYLAGSRPSTSRGGLKRITSYFGQPDARVLERAETMGRVFGIKFHFLKEGYPIDLWV